MIPGWRPAKKSGASARGGNVPNASQLVRTAAPIRPVSPASMSWQIAPPVSLPTMVTLSRPSAAMKSPTSPATPCGERSASAFIGSSWAPSGSVGA